MDDLQIELPTPNLPLLRKCVEWAEVEAAKGDESLWRQDDYMQETACGTAYCVAGYALAISPEAQRQGNHWWRINGGEEMTPGYAAAQLLGLTDDEQYELFYDWNSIEDVRRAAETIAERAGERL